MTTKTVQVQKRYTPKLSGPEIIVEDTYRRKVDDKEIVVYRPVGDSLLLPAIRLDTSTFLTVYRPIGC